MRGQAGPGSCAWQSWRCRVRSFGTFIASPPPLSGSSVRGFLCHMVHKTARKNRNFGQDNWSCKQKKKREFARLCRSSSLKAPTKNFGHTRKCTHQPKEAYVRDRPTKRHSNTAVPGAVGHFSGDGGGPVAKFAERNFLWHNGNLQHPSEKRAQNQRTGSNSEYHVWLYSVK